MVAWRRRILVVGRTYVVQSQNFPRGTAQITRSCRPHQGNKRSTRLGPRWTQVGVTPCHFYRFFCANRYVVFRRAPWISEVAATAGCSVSRPVSSTNPAEKRRITKTALWRLRAAQDHEPKTAATAVVTAGGALRTLLPGASSVDMRTRRPTHESPGGFSRGRRHH